MRSRIQAVEMNFLHRVAELSLRNRVRSSDIRERFRVELLHSEKPFEVVQASGQDASWMSPWGGVSGMLIQEDTLERISLSTSLGKSWCPHGGIG